jgi:predicted acylesterase/phospholipase RssA
MTSKRTGKAPKRAITLAGGGPAAGLHIGALRALQEQEIDFNVWALSCIGAWVGIVHNQWTDANGNWTHGDRIKGKAQNTLEFFRNNVFRDNSSYARFPVNTVFGPDLKANAAAAAKFLSDPVNYEGLWQPNKIADAFKASASFWADPQNWGSEGNINHWMLDQVLAVNPFSRFLTSFLYLSPVNGLSRIYYKDSSFLQTIKIDNLKRTTSDDDLFIYHNAWDLKDKKLQLFSNVKKDKYKDISTESLCACSALPYIEETVEIDGTVYCEGALIDTVNFSHLLEDHRDLDEIWVSRIVDVSEARPPLNIKDALGNLCMLFAGSLGDDDVKLFKYHARDEAWTGTIYELNYFPPRPADNTEQAKVNDDKEVNFDWNWSNFDNGVKRGYGATTELLNLYSCFQDYLGNDFEGAEGYAQKLTNENYALEQVARAVTFQRTGQTGRARHAVERLLETDKVWRDYPRRELGKTFFADPVADRIMADLKAAGLPEGTKSGLRKEAKAGLREETK